MYYVQHIDAHTHTHTHRVSLDVHETWDILDVEEIHIVEGLAKMYFFDIRCGQQHTAKGDEAAHVDAIQLNVWVEAPYHFTRECLNFFAAAYILQHRGGFVVESKLQPPDEPRAHGCCFRAFRCMRGDSH